MKQSKPITTPADEMAAPDWEQRVRVRRIRIGVLAVLTGLLFVSLFVLQAFDTLKFLRPSTASETLVFFALSSFNFTAFLVLLMVLARNIIKLRREKHRGQLGAHFKTRLIVFFLLLALWPVLSLYSAMYGFLNRTVEKWFALPSDEILANANFIQTQFLAGERQSLQQLAITLAPLLARMPVEEQQQELTRIVREQTLLRAELYQADGSTMASANTTNTLRADFALWPAAARLIWSQLNIQALRGQPGAAEAQLLRENKTGVTLLAAAPTGQRGALVIAQELPPDFSANITNIRKHQITYDSLKERRRFTRRISLQTLALITVLTAFVAFWLAQYVARTIAEPVQQLGEAMARVRQGDLGVRAQMFGDHEMAQLAHSFNEMTAELSDNRRNLEERRNYIETILQNLSVGVISLDAASNLTTINPAAQRLLHLDETPTTGSGLEVLLPEEQREELRRMIRRAARVDSVAREVHFTLANQAKLDAGVTVTALRDAAGVVTGTIILLEDLSELIEAQRRAAWSEVARRMAHEIKNPLTPIRLSAERLAKKLLSGRSDTGTLSVPNQLSGQLNERQQQLVRECTTLISTEVETLQRMVDEFSTFARLPRAQLEPVMLNDIVTSAVKLYDERLDGVHLETRLAAHLPPAWLDAEQIKRVLVNLIDNAAEAMLAETKLTENTNEHGHAAHRITIATRELVARDALELSIADTGPGIPQADRERIFDPYFSTRKRGTGLGLAIVSRIIAEHQGRIRVSDNLPHGTRFTIELPLTA